MQTAPLSPRRLRPALLALVAGLAAVPLVALAALIAAMWENWQANVKAARPKADLARFHPGWKSRTWHEIRQAQNHPEQTNAENDSLFPAREMKHGRVESPG